MKDRTIEIEINEDGSMRAETKGMQGPICAEELEKALAGVAGKRQSRNTKDYYKRPRSHQAVKVGVK